MKFTYNKVVVDKGYPAFFNLATGSLFLLGHTTVGWMFAAASLALYLAGYFIK